LKEKAGKEKYEGKVVDRKGDGASLDSLLQKLPRCVSRNLIDQLTVWTDTIFLYVCTFETVMSYYS
jgi:hypothetical protein